ncbi:hypothetical protein ACJMK2_006883, partial [Sinanodonta woodiana]
QAEEVQNYIFRHYQKATQNIHSGKDSILERHLIKGGNSDIKDLLEFAYGNTDWNKKVEVEGDKLYVFGTLTMKEKAEEAVQTITQWYHGEILLTEDEKEKADEAIRLVRREFPEVFIKQINNNENILLSAANGDNFEKAKHKIKVALGQIKITSRGRNNRSLFPVAAGRELDQESEEYVRRHGIIPVTQCCVTSAGRLSYRCVIHVVGPQWHDYKHNEKDKCGDDLKKTIVNCLIKATSLKINSIGIPSISSG